MSEIDVLRMIAKWHDDGRAPTFGDLITDLDALTVTEADIVDGLLKKLFRDGAVSWENLDDGRREYVLTQMGAELLAASAGEKAAV